MDKPTKPSTDLPSSFGGVKENFSASKILSGYEKDVPDIFGGPNINYMLDTLGQRQQYYDTIVDFINGLPIGKTITTDSNNKLVYDDLRVDLSGLANTNLSNLTSTGENHFANKDLSNLTEIGEKHFLNKKQITNCILENPLNINLTLKDGVLKLYAGSKFYIPNGVNTFTEYTTSADITDVQTFTGQALVFPAVHNGTISLSYYVQNSNVFISDTPPTSAVFPAGVTDGLWYDYVNNRFSQSTNAGATWVNAGEVGFPIALIQCASTGIFNIIQVFNGFGYFGNFVYYTPDLKVLAPWGRNTDGAMNNIEYTTSKCYLQYFTPYQPTDSTSVYFFINTNDGTFTNIYMQDYYETPTQPIRTDTTIWYNTDYNAFDFKPQGAIGTVYWTEVPIAKLFTAEITNGQITSVSANYPVNLVDSSHRSWIAHQSMPRSGGVYYTVGQSEASYTAYYDGYVLVDGYAMTDYDNYLYVYSEERAGLFANCLSSKSGYQAFIFIPIRAGATFRIAYGNFNNLTCKLIPLNGGS